MAHCWFSVSLPLAPTLGTPTLVQPYSRPWDRRPRRTAGPSSRNKQEKETRKAQSPGLPPLTKAQAQELGKRPASNQHARVHTHNTQGQTNRPKSINKHNWASKEEARVALVAPHAHCSLPLGCATQPSVARMMAVPKMPTLSPRSFIWFQNSTRRVLCQ